MPQRSEIFGRDRIEFDCVFLPDQQGGVPAAVMGSAQLALPCIFLPDGYEGPRPGYPWVEAGRMVLSPETNIRTGAQAWNAAAAPDQTAGVMVNATTVKGLPAVQSAYRDMNGAVSQRATASAIHAALAGISSPDGSAIPTAHLAQYAPTAPLPLPPVFVPGTLENEEFVRSAIRAGQAIADAIANILRNEQSDEKPAVTDHGQQRQDEARSNPNRDVGDPNRVVREGRKFSDTATGNTIYVDGNRVVVVEPNGRTTQFKNTRSNTERRIRSGRWVPAQ